MAAVAEETVGVLRWKCGGRLPSAKVRPQALHALPHPTPNDPAQASPQPTEVLAGSIERVTFHNAENGFCVLRIKARGHRDLVTVVGHAAEISAGEWVTLSGTWVNSREHGQQFKASFLRASAPTTAEGIEKYLGSGMISGITSSSHGRCSPLGSP